MFESILILPAEYSPFFLSCSFLFLLFVNTAPAASEREIIGSGARQSVRTCHRCIDPARGWAFRPVRQRGNDSQRLVKQGYALTNGCVPLV